MARPQLENGHTKIANEILERLMKLHLSPNQWRVLLYIIRKTYGYQKKADYISNSQVVQATGLCKSVVSRSVNNLEDMNIIHRNGKHIGLQKDWETWEKLAVSSTSENGKKLAVSSTSENGKKLAVSSTLDTKLAVSSTSENGKKLAVSSTKVSNSVTLGGGRGGVLQKKKESIYISNREYHIYIFNLWNELKICVHKKLTPDVIRVIDSLLEDYTRDEIEQSMRNYAEIVKGEQYYFNYKWTLIEFLSRRNSNNIERFQDIEVARSNFKKEQNIMQSRKAHDSNPDKFIEGKYGHMVQR